MYVSHVCEMEQSRNLCFLESFSQAGSWDSLLPCCNVCTWTQLSSSYKIQRNNIGLKITVCLGTWGKFCTKRYKKTKKEKKKSPPKLPFLKQKQGTAHVPCTQYHKGMGKPSKPLLQSDPLDTPLPSIRLRNKPVPSPWGRSNGTCYLLCSILQPAQEPQ